MRQPRRIRARLPLVAFTLYSRARELERHVMDLSATRPAARRGSRLTLRLALVALFALGNVTCEAGKVFGPVGVENVELSWMSDTTLIVGGVTTPVVRVEQGSQPLAAPRLRYTSSNPNIIEISARGDSLIAKSLGRADVIATLQSSLFPDRAPSLTRAIEVVVKDLRLDRTAVSFTSVGDTATLVARAFDAADREIAAPIVWSSSDTATASVNAQGRVTSRRTGQAEIVATTARDTARAQIRVEQRLARFEFNPPTVVLDAIGAQDTIVATAVDSSGAIVPGVQPFWESENATVATVDTVGRVTALDNGVTYIVAVKGPIRNSVRVIVSQRATRVVMAARDTAVRSLLDTTRFSATAYDRLNSAVRIPGVIWTSLDPDVAKVDQSGLVTGLAEGWAPIVAAMDGARDTIIVTVRNEPFSVSLEPKDTTIASVRDTVAMRALVRNARGAPIPGAAVSWRSSDTTIARVTASGLAIATGKGSAQITASHAALSASTGVTVTNAPASLAIVADVDTIRSVGGSLAPAVNISNARGDPLPRNAVTWTSRDTAVATVSADGIITARRVDTTRVFATFGALRDSIGIVVTDVPVSVVVVPALDTLAKVGHQITYTAEPRNAAGNRIPGYPVAWRSTDPAVATVSSGGTVTAAGFGATLIIAQAGAATDTVTVVVRNLTLLHVDNSTTNALRFGTLARPHVTIQDGVNSSDANDTVFVHVGSRPYFESVALGVQVTLLGDDADYRANGSDPLRLPIIAHDTGAVGISVMTAAPVVIKSLALRHSVDGPAVDVAGSGVWIENFHVNPGAPAFRIGRGIHVRNATTSTTVSGSRINAVVGYGVRLEDVSNGRITGVTVFGVDSVAGTTGGGIQIVRGIGNVVESNVVRATAGPRIELDSTVAAQVLNNALLGRHQLMRLRGVSGATVLGSNVFDLAMQATDPFSTGSASDGRSALEIRASTGVSVSGNTFVEASGHAMDAVRIIDTRGGDYGGVRIASNSFRGGRYHVRSTRSSWTMQNSRSDSATRPIVAEESDSIYLASDTLGNTAGRSCVDARGAGAKIAIVGGLFANCASAAADTGGPAILVNGSLAMLSIADARFSGPNETVVSFTGDTLIAQRNTMSGLGTRTVPRLGGTAAIEANANGVVVLGNSITDYRGVNGLNVVTKNLRVEENLIARQRWAIALLNWNSATMFWNDFADNDSGAVVNSVNRNLTATLNWWGDARGPRRSLSPDAVGDSVLGRIAFDPVSGGPFRPGTTTDSLRIVRGNNQSAPWGTPLLRMFSVRVVDAAGRPVSGIPVTFTVTSGGGSFGGASSVTTTSNASGLAEARLTLGPAAGANTATASAAPVPLKTVTFTATGQ